MKNRKARILVVDDNETWRIELVRVLEEAGFYSTSASTVHEALSMLQESLYHVVTLDIRMSDSNSTDVGGLDLLRSIYQQGLHEAVQVIMLTAYGTVQTMRHAFRNYDVADFISKAEFYSDDFVEDVTQLLSKHLRINLELDIHWQQIHGPEQTVLGVKLADGSLVKPGNALQRQIAIELDDLLCRLFSDAESILVRPMTSGWSNTRVLWVQPFYAGAGAGKSVVVKFGNAHQIKSEHDNFKKFVEPFVEGGSATSILTQRRTQHLAGIVYSLLGTTSDQLEDFGGLYRRADISQVKGVLDQLFLDTCGTWYANPGRLQPLNLSERYKHSFHYSSEKLEQVITGQLNSVEGKDTFHFKSLKSERTFPNPLSITTELTFVLPTYTCITHGDCNPQNILIDSTGHTWLIDFQNAAQSHILRDFATLDSAIRFQLLAAEDASLDERLLMEDALCSIERFSQIEQLTTVFSTTNPTLAKAYSAVTHLRSLAYKVVQQNPSDDIREYYVALLYIALNILQSQALSLRQREHTLLSACLLAERLV